MDKNNWLEYQSKLKTFQQINSIDMTFWSSHPTYYFEAAKKSARQEIQAHRIEIKKVPNARNRVLTYFDTKKYTIKNIVYKMLYKHFGYSRVNVHEVKVSKAENAYTFSVQHKNIEFQVVADKHWRKIIKCPGKVIGLGAEARLINECHLVRSDVNGFGIDLYRCNLLSLSNGELREEEVYLGINFEYNFFAYSAYEKNAIKNVQKKIGKYVSRRLLDQ